MPSSVSTKKKSSPKRPRSAPGRVSTSVHKRRLPNNLAYRILYSTPGSIPPVVNRQTAARKRQMNAAARRIQLSHRQALRGLTPRQQMLFRRYERRVENGWRQRKGLPPLQPFALTYAEEQGWIPRPPFDGVPGAPPMLQPSWSGLRPHGTQIGRAYAKTRPVQPVSWWHR